MKRPGSVGRYLRQRRGSGDGIEVTTAATQQRGSGGGVEAMTTARQRGSDDSSKAVTVERQLRQRRGIDSGDSDGDNDSDSYISVDYSVYISGDSKDDSEVAMTAA